ncbi:MAG: hypothetical protein ACM4AI_02365 [Acidobacteriota bacterium]
MACRGTAAGAFALMLASMSCGTARPSDEIDGLWIGNVRVNDPPPGAFYIVLQKDNGRVTGAACQISGPAVFYRGVPVEVIQTVFPRIRYVVTPETTVDVPASAGFEFNGILTGDVIQGVGKSSTVTFRHSATDAPAICLFR